MEGRRVWVTRAEPGATATAERLRARGRAPLVASLLEVRAVEPGAASDARLDPHDVLAFTSANAVRAFARLRPEREAAVWAVGGATARAAREAGFTRVRSAEGDVAALARAILADPPHARLLHPRGRETAGDLVGALQAGGLVAGELGAGGLQARSVVVYETTPVATLPRAAERALAAGEVEAVLLHSPKAARALAGFLAGSGPATSALSAFGLSPACVAPLDGLGFAARVAAPVPTEDALLEALWEALGP